MLNSLEFPQGSTSRDNIQSEGKGAHGSSPWNENNEKESGKKPDGSGCNGRDDRGREYDVLCGG